VQKAIGLADLKGTNNPLELEVIRGKGARYNKDML